MKGVEAVFIFRFYQFTKDFTEAHKTSKGGLEDFKSSENVFLMLGGTRSTQIHQKILISNNPCKWKMQDYRQMAWLHSSKLCNKVFSLNQLFFLLLKKDLTYGIIEEERCTRTISR